MREYVADKQVGKRMCRQRRRGMLVHKVGVAVLVLSLCGMLVADAALVRRAGGFSPEVLVLMAAVSFFFCLVAALGAAAMLGPGRELLMTRPWEACRFTQDAFELEYRPRPHTEEKDYERVMYRMLYADICRVEYDGSCERLLVFGRHTVARYYTANGKQYAGTINITDVPLCVFHYYEAFDEIEASLKRLAQAAQAPGAFAQ